MDDYYAQATFGKSKRLYTFKVAPTVLLSEEDMYEVIADETVYSTPICIKKILNKVPEGLDGIYLKTIYTAKLIKEDLEKEPEKETTISFL